MHQPDLNFDGYTYDPDKDAERLTGQLLRVWSLMRDGKWRSPEEIAAGANVRLTTVLSRVRDLRKDKFGKMNVESRRSEGGLWLYRIAP